MPGEDVESARDYVEKMRESGYTDEQIREKLRGAGWAEGHIDEVLVEGEDEGAWRVRAPDAGADGESAEAKKAETSSNHSLGRNGWAVIGALVLIFGVIFFWVIPATQDKGESAVEETDEKVLPWATRSGLRKLNSELQPVLSGEFRLSSATDKPVYTDANAYSGTASVTVQVVGQQRKIASTGALAADRKLARSVAITTCKTVRRLRPRVTTVDVSVDVYDPDEMWGGTYWWRQSAAGKTVELLRSHKAEPLE